MKEHDSKKELAREDGYDEKLSAYEKHSSPELDEARGACLRMCLESQAEPGYGVGGVKDNDGVESENKFDSSDKHSLPDLCIEKSKPDEFMPKSESRKESWFPEKQARDNNVNDLEGAYAYHQGKNKSLKWLPDLAFSKEKTEPESIENDRSRQGQIAEAQSTDYRPAKALDLFKQHATPDEKPLLKEWLKQGLSTAVHESFHLLSKEELGGYLMPDLTRFPRIDADKQFGRDNYLPTPKATITGMPKIPGMTDTYLTGRQAASSATDFGFWIDELNAYSAETLLHKENGGQGVDVNFTGVTMFGAGFLQYLNKLTANQQRRLVTEHGETLRKVWSTTEDALAYGAQRFPTDSANYFNSFFSKPENKKAVEQLMGRKLRIPKLSG